MNEPTWAKVKYDKIDYQDLYYYSAPKQKVAPQSLDEVDPKILETYNKLGIPLKEQEVLAGVVAVDGEYARKSLAEFLWIFAALWYLSYADSRDAQHGEENKIIDDGISKVAGSDVVNSKDTGYVREGY